MKDGKLEVGDILTYSWGYDQTNVDAFQVVRTSKASVWLERIATREVDASHVVPVKDAFTGPGYFESYPIEKRRKHSSFNDTEYVVFESGGGFLWDGRPLYETPAGFGH